MTKFALFYAIPQVVQFFLTNTYIVTIFNIFDWIFAEIQTTAQISVLFLFIVEICS